MIGSIFYVYLVFLCLGNQDIGEDAQDQCAGNIGDVNIADAHSHTADTGDQNRSDSEQVAVLTEIYLLDHLQTGHSDEAIQGNADTAHNAAGNGIQERHEGAEEGDHNAHNSSGSNGNNRSVTGNGDTANGLTVSGVGTAAKDGTCDGADTVTQQGTAQTGIF